MQLKEIKMRNVIKSVSGIVRWGVTGLITLIASLPAIASFSTSI
jgi:hypothetical protein